MQDDISRDSGEKEKLNNMAERPDYGIVVHCHLRWDFVWQRPQHIMSRLSRLHPVLFLEDALALPEGETQGRMEITHVSDTLTVARPRLLPRPGNPKGDAEVDRRNAPVFDALFNGLINSMGWDRLVHWFYTPMAASLRERFDPVAIVYDCMDELANFKGAPANIKERETDLMAAADVVFTGGPSMYQARKDRHRNIHQFNSGVDVEHFGSALDDATEVPADMADLPRPRLLYYGVIDERMGWDNLAAVADAHPDWSIAMVGPLAKITEDDLLQRPNIYYSGQRGYDDLPGYLKGCDLALVPFALSDATRYLSPTKTLEYFAARRPVVSTPIQDIVDHYQDAARIGDTPEQFVRACEAALTEDNTERLDAGERHAAEQTWDAIVSQMAEILDAAVESSTHREDSPMYPEGNREFTTGQVRWYSGSRGASAVDTGEDEEVMAFLPGAAQEDLGQVREGDAVAVAVAGPAHSQKKDEARGADMFPLGLDQRLEHDD